MVQSQLFCCAIRRDKKHDSSMHLGAVGGRGERTSARGRTHRAAGWPCRGYKLGLIRRNRNVQLGSLRLGTRLGAVCRKAGIPILGRAYIALQDGLVAAARGQQVAAPCHAAHPRSVAPHAAHPAKNGQASFNMPVCQEKTALSARRHLAAHPRPVTPMLRTLRGNGGSKPCCIWRRLFQLRGPTDCS